MTSLGLASQMRYYEDQQRCANTDESILCHEYWKKYQLFLGVTYLLKICDLTAELQY